MLPHLVMDLLRKYFRLEVFGGEKIPSNGPVIIAPNHSGFMGFDALILSYEIFKLTKRIPRVLAHHFWFLTKTTAVPFQKFGFIQASSRNASEVLKKNNLLILFPEGETGNFKPSSKMYVLQDFKPGVIRLAIQRQCPIIPTLIVGAEESHLNISQIKFGKLLGNLVLPLPLNLIPLPVKWRIYFLDALRLPYPPSAADDSVLVNEVTQELREKMQKQLR